MKPNTRDLFNTDHNQAGKGDTERNSGFRQRYDDVNWPKSNEGFERQGHKQVKRYGPAAPPTLQTHFISIH